ncbi:hypothetical protein P3T27_005701 [Kitasatospora sp. MAA19]|uniref:hypothetical protein n=1 Tax=Kitasatospora sp. MAA19 TaxID=3035090 RepID=UPI002473C4E9|nr:hypothetical protein [Kitasatospora sp. MAA19]MDH6708955.1 hypothetical protein [Kitasatospora sp. MAA19]
MVDHPELFEDVTATLARAGFDTAPGPSRLRIGRRREGVAVGWAPGEGADGPPSRGAREAVSGAAAVVLRECGYRVAETDDGELLVTPAAEPVAVAAEPGAAPEQWWG